MFMLGEIVFLAEVDAMRTVANSFRIQIALSIRICRFRNVCWLVPFSGLHIVSIFY